MKYYKVEKDINDSTYVHGHFYICSCENKPNINTHILSNVCILKCSNFITWGEDDKGYWVDCKYYTSQIRKDKLAQLKK